MSFWRLRGCEYRHATRVGSGLLLLIVVASSVTADVRKPYFAQLTWDGKNAELSGSYPEAERLFRSALSLLDHDCYDAVVLGIVTYGLILTVSKPK
jgi:hypothetical protein